MASVDVCNNSYHFGDFGDMGYHIDLWLFSKLVRFYWTLVVGLCIYDVLHNKWNNRSDIMMDCENCSNYLSRIGRCKFCHFERKTDGEERFEIFQGECIVLKDKKTGEQYTGDGERLCRFLNELNDKLIKSEEYCEYLESLLE